MENSENIPTMETPSRPRFDWGAFASHLTTFVSVAIVVGLVLGFLLLRQPIREKAELVVSREPAKIVFEWPALRQAKNEKPAKTQTWLAQQFQEELLTRATRALGSSPDPLSREPLDAIGAAMETSGWFDGRPDVSRVGNSEIRIRGNWRVPAAVVRVIPTGGGGEAKDQLISWDGKPMPVLYPEGKSGLMVIRGAALPARTNVSGEVDYTVAWPGDDAEAGLELLRLLGNQDWHAQIAAVDVSHYAETKQLAIESTHGTRLVWGGRPAKPLTGECSTAAKLGKIAELNSISKRIDAGHAELELWWPINKPLEIDRSASAEQKIGATASVEPVRR